MTFLCSVGVLSSAGCVWILMSIYRSYKAGWYSAPGFMPPEGYRTGSLSLDRGFTQLGNEGNARMTQGILAASSSLVAVVDFNFAIYNYFNKKSKQAIKQGKKWWNSSDLVAGAHKTFVSVFDMVYNPISATVGIFTGAAPKKGKGAKKKSKR